MRNFHTLQVVDAAFVVAEQTYRVTTCFPPNERFGLTSQMRRAAVSVGSNICEGCGRSTNPQFHNFLQMAMGSANELEFQALLSSRLGFGEPESLAALKENIVIMKRMLGKLMQRVRG